jgi:hypothetical protein
MQEFNLRINDGDGFAEPFSRYSEILRPATIPSEHAEGWGSHRIRVEGIEIAFSDEEFGFQVIFDSDNLSEQRAQEIMDDITANIRNETGAATEVIPL